MAHGARARLAQGARAVCALVLAVAMGGCSLFTPSLSEGGGTSVKSSIDDSALVRAGTLTVGLSTSDAPQTMTETSGQLTGYAADVAKTIASRLGLNVAFVNAAAPGGVLTNKKVDLYLGAMPDQASDAIKSCGTYLSSAISLFGKGTASTKTLSAADLASMTIGVQDLSGSHSALTRTGITARVKTYGNVNECLKGLEAGEVDYVACEATAGAYLARQYRDLSFAGTIATPRDYEIVVSSGALGLSEKVTRVVSEISKDGVLDAIHTAWYGSLPQSLTDRLVSGITTTDAATDSEADTLMDGS